MRENFECNIPYTKSENCIIINARDWVDKSETSLILSKRNTGIQKVDGVGYTEVFKTHEIDIGDEVLITKVASQIAYLRPYEIPDDNNMYANIHQMQLIGKYIRDGSIELFYDKLQLEKIYLHQGDLITNDSSYCMFRVVNTGSHAFDSDWNKKELEVEKDMYVLLDEHVCTTFSDDFYYAEEGRVVGYFEGGSTLDDLVPLSTKILLKPKPCMDKTGSLYNPLVDLDVEDISEVYDRDRFEVIAVGKEIDTVKKGNIISVGRDYLSSISFAGAEYFYADSDEYIRGLCVD